MTDYLTALKLAVNSTNHATKKFINYRIACARSEAIRISQSNPGKPIRQRISYPADRRTENYFKNKLT